MNIRIVQLLYYLDEIYSNWTLFSKETNKCGSTREKDYTARQEVIRKDVKRVFGVILERFNILKHPERPWYRSKIAAIVKSCIILQNKAVKRRRGRYKIEMFSIRFYESAREFLGSTMSFK